MCWRSNSLMESAGGSTWIRGETFSWAGGEAYTLEVKLSPASSSWDKPACHLITTEKLFLVLVPSAPCLTSAILFSLLVLKCTLGKLRFWAQFRGAFPLRTAFNHILESNWDWVGIEWCLKRGNIQPRPGSHLQAATALLHQAKPAGEAGLILL